MVFRALVLAAQGVFFNMYFLGVWGVCGGGAEVGGDVLLADAATCGSSGSVCNLLSLMQHSWY